MHFIIKEHFFIFKKMAFYYGEWRSKERFKKSSEIIQKVKKN